MNADNILNAADKVAVETVITNTTSTGLNNKAAAVAQDSNKVTVDHVTTGVDQVKTMLGNRR